MKKELTKIFGILLILSGIGIYLYPDISGWILECRTGQYIAEFQEKYQENRNQQVPVAETEGQNGLDMDGPAPDDTAFQSQAETGMEEAGEEAWEKMAHLQGSDALYQEILAYNADIYESGQADFKDAWSCEQAPISLDGLEDGKFGYIQIPSMDVVLPLYIGASNSNMAKGAAVIGQTSIPIGGENTNSVIAGHRGWSTGGFFLNIEAVSAGDYVYITNPWQTLAYQVESIDIIDPYNTEAVMIQEGQDMVTLVTCHPYMSHGKYRYLVYCVRDMEEEAALRHLSEESGQKNAREETDAKSSREETSVVPEINSADGAGYIVGSDGTVYESSVSTIQKEDTLRKAGALAIILLVLASCLYVKIRDRKSG